MGLSEAMMSSRLELSLLEGMEGLGTTQDLRTADRCSHKRVWMEAMTGEGHHAKALLPQSPPLHSHSPLGAVPSL